MKPINENSAAQKAVATGDLFGLAAPYFRPPFRYEIGSIWGSGPGAEKLLDIRGWGHLTGGGAHNLPADKAAKIQAEIGEHIARLLNASWPNIGSQRTRPAVSENQNAEANTAGPRPGSL